MNIQEITYKYLNGNIIDTKKAIKRMSKYEFMQFIFCLQDLGVNDEKIEKLID